MTTQAAQTFELGLVLAGAISAGAYTAGVLDFLCQALAALERARADPLRQGEGAVPLAQVRLRALAGASAGALCAALLPVVLARGHQPVQADPGAHCRNPWFEAWVNRIDAHGLLDCSDLDRLQPGAAPAALLNSDILDAIARDVLHFPAQMPERPAWLTEHFDLVLTLTNLRGVPYAIRFHSGETDQNDPEQEQDTPHGMSLHADWVHFHIGPQPPPQEKSDCAAENSPGTPYHTCWDDLPKAGWLGLLRDAALASGAFPLALRPRRLTHSAQARFDLYDERAWPFFRYWRAIRPCDHADPQPLPAQAGTLHVRSLQKIKPEWDGMGGDYAFDCVDGGVMNNEPLELMRRILTQDGHSLERSGLGNDRALILIDPFPGGALPPGAEAGEQVQPDLVRTLLALLSALKQQARFKPQELVEAAAEAVFSRFLIAPARDVWPAGGEKTTLRGEWAIASGALGGFAGFLHRSLRLHDFMLGRANCQSFLRNHFVLPAENPMFGRKYVDYCRRHDLIRIKDGKECCPVIPLHDDAASAIEQTDFPRLQPAQVRELVVRLGERYDALVNALSRAYLKNCLARRAVCLLAGAQRLRVLEAAENYLTRSLRRHGLM